MKAILVMEMPESCDKCPLFSGNHSDMTCRGNYRTIDFPYPYDKVQDWCPLVPMPKKRDCAPYGPFYSEGWNMGFNACLDAIGGG